MRKGQMSMSIDSHKRSWFKAISWRVVAFFILGGVSWMFTRNWTQTTWIAIVYACIQLVLYYVHERVWERLNWGRKKAALED